MGFQKCPVCNGEGKIKSTNFEVTNYNTFKMCGTCDGRGIIDSITGMPPQQNIERSGKDGFSKVKINDIGE